MASRPTGNKKDLIRKHIGVKTWVEHPKHMLEKNPNGSLRRVCINASRDKDISAEI